VPRGAVWLPLDAAAGDQAARRVVRGLVHDGLAVFAELRISLAEFRARAARLRSFER
jgi:hypothetical protein